MTQDELLQTMDRARTLPEVREARRLVREWLVAHPDDAVVRDSTEQLLMAESALTRQPAL
jgi:hypothetical protein